MLEASVFEAIFMEFFSWISKPDENDGGESSFSLKMIPFVKSEMEVLLEISLPKNYPEIAPKIDIKDTKGLNLNMISDVNELITKTKQETSNDDVIYSLYQEIRVLLLLISF